MINSACIAVDYLLDKSFVIFSYFSVMVGISQRMIREIFLACQNIINEVKIILVNGVITISIAEYSQLRVDLYLTGFTFMSY